MIECRGKVRLRVRSQGKRDECVVLPLPWNPRSQAAALQLIGRVYQLVEAGQQTVKGPVEVVTAGSDTMSTGTNWPAAAEGLKAALMNGRNEIHA